MNFELSSKEALDLIQEDQKTYGVNRSLFLASLHGWFTDDDKLARDPAACRVRVLIGRAHPNLINV